MNTFNLKCKSCGSTLNKPVGFTYSDGNYTSVHWNTLSSLTSRHYAVLCTNCCALHNAKVGTVGALFKIGAMKSSIIPARTIDYIDGDILEQRMRAYYKADPAMKESLDIDGKLIPEGITSYLAGRYGL